MIALVNSLADLTSLRNRDELEIAMATMATSAVAASSGKLWRLVGDQGQPRLHARVMAADRRVLVCDPPPEMSDLPGLDSRRELRVCYDRNRALAVIADANGGRRTVFPVNGSTGIIGFLELSRDTALAAEEHRFVTDLLRIYRNQLEILDYSENDELTGLPNRKTFDAVFDHMMGIEPGPAAQIAQYERVERRRPLDADEPRWLAVVDVDFFKSINDRFGHPCGDAALVSLARLMRGAFRQSDRLFRCGGEEFVILLEPTPARFVATILDRFRARVEAAEFSEVGAVTVSVGYTRIAPGDDGISAFRRADEALYAAKRKGRNRVICCDELEAATAGADSSPCANQPEPAPANSPGLTARARLSSTALIMPDSSRAKNAPAMSTYSLIATRAGTSGRDFSS
jgi:diguanylate cyclase (GGDEF)-like protein